MRQAKCRKHLADTAARDEFKTDFLSWSQLEQHGGVPGEKVNNAAAWLRFCGLRLVGARIFVAHEGAA